MVGFVHAFLAWIGVALFISERHRPGSPGSLPLQRMVLRADTAEMRVSAAVSCVVALGFLAGCAPGANGELRALVEEVALPGSSSLDCEWGSSDFDSEPKSWYGCWDYVPGNLERVSRTIRSRLASKGFAVSYRRDVLSVQLTGVRGADTLCIDVLGRGFARGRNTSRSEVDISPDEVFVDVWATEPRESRGAAVRPPCAALPSFPE